MTDPSDTRLLRAIDYTAATLAALWVGASLTMRLAWRVVR